MKLTVKEANFRYHDRSDWLYMNDVSFSLAPGEVLAIIGPNGAGKTTLLKCMTGLLDWKKGETLIDDRPLKKWPTRKLWQKIGYVPQARNLAFSFTLEEFVVMGLAPLLGPFETPSDIHRLRALEALEEVGIRHLANASVREVSGGELQLAFIARALISEPELLIFDEPESHLDIQKQMTIIETIERLVRTRNVSCIMNTHYPNHAAYLADRVALVAPNEPVTIGATEQLLTEEMIERYFGLRVIQIEKTTEEGKYRSFVPKQLRKI